MEYKLQKMSISQEDFIKIYSFSLERDELSRLLHILYDPIENKQDFFSRLHSRLFRLNNVYPIINKLGDQQILVMNRPQHVYYSQLIKYRRVFLLKSRQMGMSTFSRVYALDTALTKPNQNCGIITHNGSSKKDFILSLRATRNAIDEEIYSFFGVEKVRDSLKELAFSNNSKINVATSFRGEALHFLHISELAKLSMDNPALAEEVFSGSVTAANVGNIVCIESTGMGDTLFKRKYYEYKELPESKRLPMHFYSIFISWLEDNTAWVDLKGRKFSLAPEDERYFKEVEEKLKIKIPMEKKAYWVSMKDVMPSKESIHVEFPTMDYEAFYENTSASYYHDAVLKNIINKGRVVQGLFNPEYKLYAALDIGLDDYTVIIFFQYYNNSFKIIDDYYNNRLEIGHYARYIRDYENRVSAVYLPHDGAKRSVIDLRSPADIMHDLGIKFSIVQRNKAIVEGIDLVRGEISNMWIDERARYTLDCLLNYKQGIDKRTMRPNGKPIHDQHSHGADAIRYMCQARNMIDTTKVGAKITNERTRFRL